MSKVPLTHLVNLQNETTAVNLINNNMDTIENGFENTLSRDGTQPNSMTANLDMNSNRILNLSAPISPTEPVRLGDVNVNDIIVTSSRSFSTKSLAVASTIPISVDTIETLGYSIPGDNGGASYKRISDPSSSSPAYFQSADGQWWGLSNTDCKVEMFGAQRAPIGSSPGTIANSTTAVQACIDFVAVNKLGTVNFSAGMYGIQSVNISTNAMYIKGEGILVTEIFHILPGSPNCFNFSAGASELFDTGISDLTILTNDFVNAKIAINVRDVSTFYCKNVQIISLDGSRYRSTGGTAVGLHIEGRELGRVENLQSAADTPLKISVNPNYAPISLDSWVFEDCFLYTDLATSHCIIIDTGVNLYNTTIKGRQNWIGGKDGLHWIDTTSTAESLGLAISGARAEQGNDSTGYMINIQHNTGLKGLIIKDSSGGGDRCGIKLRKAIHSIINNYTYLQSAFEALNIDSSNITVKIDNCTWWNAATVTITGLNRAFSEALTPTGVGVLPQDSSVIPTDAFYTTSNNPILVNAITADSNLAASTFNNVHITAPASAATISLASGITATFPATDTYVGSATTNTFTNKTINASNNTLTGTASGLTAGNVTTNANLTGDVTSVGNVTTLTNAPVIAKVLTGYTSGAGVVSASDSILSAIQKLNGNDATNANLTGDVTSVGNATTLTNAPVIAKVLTGYTSGAGTVSSADSILSAIQKLNGNDATNANLTGDVTSVGNATTLTNAPVIAKVLTGYTSGAGTISSADSILSAIQKLNGNDATNANLTGDVTSVGNATTLTNAPVIAKVLTAYSAGAGTVVSTDSILQAIQKLGGLVDNAAWSTYTSTFGATSGTATVTAKQKTIGKTVFVNIDVTYTSAIVGQPTVTLPTNSVNAGVMASVGLNTGTPGVGDFSNASNVVNILGTVLTNGTRIIISGSYESV